MIFYRLYVPYEKRNDKLVLNLTPLDNGDADLFLNKNDSLPTLREHDWSSEDVAGDFIVVENKEEGISGYYTVGVYGITKCSYTISFSTGKYLISKISENEVL